MVEALAGSLACEQAVTRFLTLLVERNRLNLLNDIVAAYRKFLDESLGLVRAQVTSASELDARQKQVLATRLERLTGKRVRMEVAVDSALIGGFIARVGGTIYDGSIRQQLQMFKRRLVQD